MLGRQLRDFRSERSVGEKLLQDDENRDICASKRDRDHDWACYKAMDPKILSAHEKTSHCLSQALTSLPFPLIEHTVGKEDRSGDEAEETPSNSVFCQEI